VPLVLVDVMRGGPGLGNIAPSQGDYYQVVKSAGHGDFHAIVLAPATVQEAIDLTAEAFDLAERYRHIVVVLLDGNIGQMMEPAELPPMKEINTHRPDWALGDATNRRVITSIHLLPEELETFNCHLQEKIERMRNLEVRYHETMLDDAELIVVAYGTAGRVAQSAVKLAREQGSRVGLLRPITLFPFPEQRISQLADEARGFLVVELSAGQMLDDVRIAVAGQAPVRFFGRMGGMVPMPEEILAAIVRLDQDTAWAKDVHEHTRHISVEPTEWR